jgi:hypothetical protein
MDLQQAIADVGDQVERLGDIESNVGDKISLLEDLRDRANDTQSTLQEHLDSLQAIDEAMSEADQIMADANNEGLDN